LLAEVFSEDVVVATVVVAATTGLVEVVVVEVATEVVDVVVGAVTAALGCRSFLFVRLSFFLSSFLSSLRDDCLGFVWVVEV